jgi:hypothetical protein
VLKRQILIIGRRTFVYELLGIHERSKPRETLSGIASRRKRSKNGLNVEGEWTKAFVPPKK